MVRGGRCTVLLHQPEAQEPGPEPGGVLWHFTYIFYMQKENPFLQYLLLDVRKSISPLGALSLRAHWMTRASRKRAGDAQKQGNHRATRNVALPPLETECRNHASRIGSDPEDKGHRRRQPLSRHVLRGDFIYKYKILNCMTC